MPRNDSAYSTFCFTVFHGNRAKFWNTIPRSGPGARTTPAWVRITPCCTGMNPPIRYSSVDLPHPLGPSSAWNWFLGMLSEMSDNAVTAAPRRGV